MIFGESDISAISDILEGLLYVTGKGHTNPGLNNLN